MRLGTNRGVGAASQTYRTGAIMNQARLNKIHTRMAAVGVLALVATAGWFGGERFAQRYDVPPSPVPVCVTSDGSSQPTCHHYDPEAGTVIVFDYGRWNYELNTGDVIRTTE